MEKLFKCEIHYFRCRHLSQIYDGFEKLRKNNIVELTYKPIKQSEFKPFLSVIINNKYKVIYDMSDGTLGNQIQKEKKLKELIENCSADFYFMRTFPKEHLNLQQSVNVYPLGLYYFINEEQKYSTIKNYIKNFSLVRFLLSDKIFYPSQSMEQLPLYHKDGKIVCITKLWDQDESISIQSNDDRDKINEERINLLYSCRTNLSSNFFGGLISTPLAEKICPDLVLPTTITERHNYLKIMHKCNIGISTQGLHNSIGARFGEYIAASRVVMSSPFNCQLPGNLSENKNYILFSNPEELICKYEDIKNNKDLISDIMINNFNYYNSYLRPDRLVLNTLLKVINIID